MTAERAGGIREVAASESEGDFEAAIVCSGELHGAGRLTPECV